MICRSITLGVLSTLLIPVVIDIAPAHAVKTFIFNETEGNIKSVGSLQDNANYVLRGSFGGNPSDTIDTFSFVVPKKGQHTITITCNNLCPIQNGKVSIFRVGRGIIKVGSTGVNKPLVLNLSSGNYRLVTEGKPSVSTGGFVAYQSHILTPR